MTTKISAPFVRKLLACLFFVAVPINAVRAGVSEGQAALERKDFPTALREFRVAAEHGDPTAQFHLGDMYKVGQGVPKDPQQAVLWFRKAADQGDTTAQVILGIMYRFGEGVPKDAQQAAFWYRKAADQGYAYAQSTLGDFYRDGHGVSEDAQQAAFWYRKAADQGHAFAQYELGLLYVQGTGVSKDAQQAAFWFRKAADQGVSFAQLQLGFLHDQGRGVSKDAQQAAFWFRKAADLGDVIAQSNLGLMYALGKGVSKDTQQAAFWFRKAADLGNAMAQFSLGVAYDQGEGVSKDAHQAAFWYRKAADQGDAMAQGNLGLLYDLGRGVPKDEQQAVLWYRKAADQGHATAQYNLGLMYALGKGVSKDEQQAYFWWLLASAQSNAESNAPSTKNRDLVEAQLSPAQRTAAQAAARNWKPVRADSANAPPATAPFMPSLEVAKTTSVPDSTGSGFAVSGNRVVTNAHVVEGCARLNLVGGGVAQVRAVDRRSDLALLDVSGLSKVATLRAGRLRQGDPVSVVGFPLSGILASGAQITSGNVSALAGMQNDTRFIQISAPVQPGNSGGPLVDSSGNVVGVVVSKLNALKIAEFTGDIPQNVNFAVSPLVLQGFLEANNVDYQSAASTRTLSTADVAQIAKRYTFSVQCWK